MKTYLPPKSCRVILYVDKITKEQNQSCKVIRTQYDQLFLAQCGKAHLKRRNVYTQSPTVLEKIFVTHTQDKELIFLIYTVIKEMD